MKNVTGDRYSILFFFKFPGCYLIIYTPWGFFSLVKHVLLFFLFYNILKHVLIMIQINVRLECLATISPGRQADGQMDRQRVIDKKTVEQTRRDTDKRPDGHTDHFRRLITCCDQ